MSGIFILGIVWLARTTVPAGTWVEQNPRLARRLTIALVVICTLIVIASLIQRLGV